LDALGLCPKPYNSKRISDNSDAEIQARQLRAARMKLARAGINVDATIADTKASDQKADYAANHPAGEEDDSDLVPEEPVGPPAPALPPPEPINPFPSIPLPPTATEPTPTPAPEPIPTPSSGASPPVTEEIPLEMKIDLL